MDYLASYNLLVYIWKYLISVAKVMVEKLTEINIPLTVQHQLEF